MKPVHAATFVIAAAACACACACACAPPPPPPPPSCNGHAELCARPFDDVVLPGSHNAMSTIEDDFAAPNQRQTIARQLDLGVRAFLVDTYAEDDGLFLCHANCLLGKTPLVDALTTFREFLEADGDDVIALLIEDYATPQQLEQAMAASRLIEHVVVHDANAPWPTMQELGGKVFVTAEHSSPPPAWNHAMFSQYVDTPFSFATLDDLAAPPSCDRNRGSDENALMLVNHWAEDPFPDEEVAAAANAHEFLIERARRCAEVRHHVPNVVAVDYVASGDLFDVVDELNGF